MTTIASPGPSTAVDAAIASAANAMLWVSFVVPSFLETGTATVAAAQTVAATQGISNGRRHMGFQLVVGHQLVSRDDARKSYIHRRHTFLSRHPRRPLPVAGLTAWAPPAGPAPNLPHHTFH